MSGAPKVETVVAIRDRLGETPLWCEKSRLLWWVDIEIPTMHSYDPSSGVHQSYKMPGKFLGSQALTDGEKRLVAIDLGLVLWDPSTEEIEPLVELESGLDNRLNDGRVDRMGRLWIGSMDNEYVRPNGALYRVEAGGAVEKQFGEVKVTNGIAFSPDDKLMYFTDTRRHLIWSFDFDVEAGVISNRRLFRDFSASGDRPDGTIVDVDGCLWIAFFAGHRICRLRPDGEIDRVIELPVTSPTCACFGGPDLKTLYITTASKFMDDAQLAAEPLAGSLLAVEGIGQGLPEHRFRLEP